MTNAEYQKQYRRARQQFPKLTQRAMRDILRAYRTAGNRAAKFVAGSLVEGLTTPTAKAYVAFQSELKKAAKKIAADLETVTPGTVKKAADATAEVHVKFLSEAVDAAEAGAKIAKVGIKNLYVGVNDNVVRDLVSRTSRRGYTFSKSVWNTAGDFPVQMNRVVAAGIAQGRDVIDIARDITAYVNDGKTAMIKRYGKLKRGTAKFAQRISDDVSWQALRLVRSELYMSLQNASVAQGKATCAADGKYDWVLSGGGQHSCICGTLADNSPYGQTRIPNYPHPNCRCTITPRLRDEKKFNADLKRWAEGEKVGYIDKWYENVYSKI